jgi:hypothetical protein
MLNVEYSLTLHAKNNKELIKTTTCILLQLASVANACVDSDSGPTTSATLWIPDASMFTCR